MSLLERLCINHLVGMKNNFSSWITSFISDYKQDQKALNLSAIATKNGQYSEYFFSRKGEVLAKAYEVA